MGAFDTTCTAIESMLDGGARRTILDDASQFPTLREGLLRLRGAMRSHVWPVGLYSIDLARPVHRLDRRTRQVGFHVLNDWDGVADRVNDDTIPVDVLHYLEDRRGDEPSDRVRLAVLLDYYFMHLLALLSLRIWDEGDANANLDRLGRMLASLQGPGGSGQHFAAGAETLILIATSHYELHERGYHVLLEQTRRLNQAHRTRIAMGHAVSMGCHLRFGFEATYGRDTVNMRDDNVADYPWLCFALSTVMDEYDRLVAAGAGVNEQRPLAEALLNGLSADARAFIGAPPPSLADCEDERARFADAFGRHKEKLLREFESFRPSADAYSPLCFFFNFAHNVVKGTVIDALLNGNPWRVTLDDLLTSGPSEEKPERRRELAETLMGYARANPHRIRGKLRPVIVYDVQSGREAFSVALRKLRE